MTTRVLIVDDHPAMRHGLSQLIENEPDLTVCGDAGCRNEALSAFDSGDPDLVLLDISMDAAAGSGIDLIPDFLTRDETVGILIYTMHDEKVYAERALRAGARGYLMKQRPVPEIIEAIRSVRNGDVYLSAEIRRELLLRHVGPDWKKSAPSPVECLSEREFEVLRLIGQGLPPREIAGALFLSTKTVETHRLNIRKKLGFKNAAELRRFAVSWLQQVH